MTIISPGFVENLGFDALNLYSDLLQAAAPPRKKNGALTSQDGSSIWHPKIELDDDLHGVRNLLVSATRNAALQLAHVSQECAMQVVTALDARPTKVFQRIGLEVLRREKETSSDFVRTHLTNKANFNDSSIKHEYQRLLHDAFAILTPADQETVLDWIRQGPPSGEYESWETFSGQQSTPERRERYTKLWQRGHLTPIAGQLPPAMADHYGALLAELGTEEAVEEGLFVATRSPITKEGLEAKSPIELVEYLAVWTPTDEFLGPSRAGIGLDLTSLVAADPRLLDSVIDRLHTLHPTYLRSYYYGIREGVERDRSVSWSHLFNLATWVVSQAYSPPAERDPFRDDEDWGSTRSAIAEVLIVAINKGVPFEFRASIWNIVAALAQDPDPDVVLEQEQGRPVDLISVAINSTRGKAIEAVIKYALWVRKNDPSAGMPSEVRALLEDHLQHDESLAIRSVYGRFFPWLVSLDRDWAAVNADTSFGEPRGVAAWDSYLISCPAYDDTVALLGPYYERAINALQPDGWQTPRKPDPNEHLGEHIMAGYWRGQLALNGVSLSRFLGQAPASVRTHAFSYIGRSLCAEQGAVPAEIQERLKELWTARTRLPTTTDEQYRKELETFGWWFAAGKLDRDWELHQLRDVLRVTHRTCHDMSVLARLAVVATTHTVAVLQCLLELSKGEDQYFTIEASEGDIRIILNTALNSNEGDTKNFAHRIINDLGVMGHTKLRTLLRRPEPR